MRLIGKIAFDLVAVIPAIALAACAGGGGAGVPAARLEASSITLDVVPTADAAGIYLAEDDGYFAAQGLTVTLKPVGDDEDGIGDLQAGAAQLAAGSDVSFILAQVAGEFAAKPISMRMIADTSRIQPGNQALYVPAGSPYKTAADLVRAHATVGVNPGSVPLGALLGYAFKRRPAADSQLPGLLAEHKIAAAWLAEPFGTLAQQEYGAVQLADYDQGAARNLPTGTIVGGTSWVRSHPGTVAAFLRALRQGQAAAGSDRPAVEQALVKHAVVPSAEIAATMTLGSYPLSMNVAAMQRVPDAMYESGLITFKYEISGMIEPESGEVR